VARKTRRRVIEFDGARDLYKKTSDPRWAWRAIQDRIHRHEPFPDWILEYLDGCARGILRAKGDLGRELVPALGFSGKSGPKRDDADLLMVEQFAMAFAAEIFQGTSAGKARKKAADRCGAWKDDKDRKRRLKDFFGGLPTTDELKTIWPNTNLEWRLVISRWLLMHPGYTEHYPGLPTRFEFPSPPPG
jgi:hypothetical protein